jgi:hypothetical protein
VNGFREHEGEAVFGLPEPLPRGERMLWQGAPHWPTLARRAFHVPALAAYFGIILALHAATQLGGGRTLGEALNSALGLVPLAAAALALLTLLAWLASRTTVYTLTDRRVVMRIGIVLSVTWNLPFSTIESAGFRRLGGQHGDIPLALKGGERIAWLQLWPHARPWRVSQPQPMLRCVPDADRVASLLADAWATANGQALPATAADAAPAPADASRDARGTAHAAAA